MINFTYDQIKFLFSTSWNFDAHINFQYAQIHILHSHFKYAHSRFALPTSTLYTPKLPLNTPLFN